MKDVTADTILDFMQNAVASKKAMNPQFYLDAAMKLELVMADEHEKLENIRTAVARKKLALLEAQTKKNVAAVEVEIEASDEYQRMRLQEHKVDRCEEFVRLAKLQSRTAAGM